MVQIPNKKVLDEGWHISSQTPIDDRLHYENTTKLINLGPGDQLAYRYYEGMRVWCLLEGEEYIWVESEVGLLTVPFVYPNNVITNGIVYSNRTFNFVLVPNVKDLVAGTNISIDRTNPSMPIISATNSGGGLVNKTYSEISTLKQAGQLSKGSFYNMTDFQTVYDQPDYVSADMINFSLVSKTSSVEPIILFATSTDTLSKEVWMPSRPQWRFEYDLDFDYTEFNASPAKGRITYAEDNKGNSAHFDFGVVLYKRYESVMGSGNFDCHWDTGFGTSKELPWLGDNCENNKDGRVSLSEGIVLILNNNVLSDYCSNNTNLSDCINNTYGVFCRSITHSHGCKNNSYDQYCSSIASGDRCTDNKFGSTASNNNLGNDCTDNIIAPNFKNNNLGNMIIGINFTGSTHVYQLYDCHIKLVAVGNAFLDYSDLSGQRVVALPTD